MLDETEVDYTSNIQLLALSKEIFAGEPTADYCDVYDRNSQEYILKMRKTPKGSIYITYQKKSNNWGGKRAGQYAVRKDDAVRMKHNICIPMKDEMYKEMSVLGNQRAEYIRQAIREKFEREHGYKIPEKFEEPKDKDAKDTRYARTLKVLPVTLRIYDGQDLRRENLTIEKVDKYKWRVRYGQPIPDIDSPCFEDSNLLNALEHMVDWLHDHGGNKWIIR